MGFIPETFKAVSSEECKPPSHLI